MHRKDFLIVIFASILGSVFGEIAPVAVNNSALQYLTNKTKGPDGSTEIKAHIKTAWEKDPILSRIEAFQNLTNELGKTLPGNKRGGILNDRKQYYHKPYKHTIKIWRKMIINPWRKTHRRLKGFRWLQGPSVAKRTKYLNISLKLARTEPSVSSYEASLRPKEPQVQPSDARQEQVGHIGAVHHFAPYRFSPLQDHKEFHYKPLFPGLSPQLHTTKVEVKPNIEVQTESHENTEEIQDQVNKLVHESEALRQTAAKFESKAKELVNEAEILHHETVSSDGHNGHNVGEMVAHTPVEEHETVTIVQPALCDKQHGAHVEVQEDFPVYHIPCKTPEQPIVEYHRPEPPPIGVNPYEILTSDMLNEENYHPQMHLQHQRQQISAKNTIKNRNYQRKRKIAMKIKHGEVRGKVGKPAHKKIKKKAHISAILKTKKRPLRN